MIYVDDYGGRFRRFVMSHMFAYPRNDAELHRFAEKIGLDQSWFQDDHYDVSQSKRREAIDEGAEPIDVRRAVFLLRKGGKG